MTAEPFPDEALRLPTAPKKERLSRKQAVVVEYLRENGCITLAQAVRLVGLDIYANAEKHVGALLSNMVRRGMIVRVEPGLFELPQ